MPISIGIARGRIEIDTQDISRARVVVERETKLMGKHFEETGKKADSSAKQTVTAWEKAGEKLNKITSGLTPLAIGGGLITGIALKAASGIETIDRRFRSLTKTQAEADKLMNRIAASAGKFGRPVGEMQQAFADLLPKLKDGERNLEKYVGLVSRLASLRKSEGTSGAAFALGEAMSSGGTDLISLSERFGISKIDLRAAIAQTGDFASGLDLILNKMGATEQAAIEAGKGFDAAATRAGESFSRALGKGIDPFRSAMTGVFNVASSFFDLVGEHAPILMTFTTGLGGLAAAGGALVLVLGQLVSAYNALNAAGVISGIKGLVYQPKMIGPLLPGQSRPGGVTGLGKAGAAAAGGLAGIEIGTDLVRGLGNLGVGGLSQFKGKDQDEAKAIIGDTIKQVVVMFVSALLDLSKALATAQLLIKKAFDFVVDVLTMGANEIKRAVGSLIEGFAGMIDAIGMAVANLPGGVGKDLGGKISSGAVDLARGGVLMQNEAEAAQKAIMPRLMDVLLNGIRLTDKETSALEKASEGLRKSILGPLVEFLFPKQEEVESAVTSAAPAEKYTQAQVDLWREFRAEMGEIDNEENAKRLEENERYQEQKTDIERRGNEARIERDKDIAAAKADRAKTELESEKERDENIAKLKADTEKDDRRRVEDHERELRDIRSKSRTDMLKAARNLDAQGVFDAIQSRKERISKENEEFAIEQQRRADDIAERIALEETGHQQRLLKAQEAETKQLAQIEERYNKEAATLARAMDKLEADHGKRLDDIKGQANREREARKAEYDKEYDQLETHAGRKLARIIKANNDELAEMDRYHHIRRSKNIALLNESLSYTAQSRSGTVYSRPVTVYGEQGYQTTQTSGRRRIEFQTGTNRVPYTGAFNLHEGEGVIRPDVNRMVRSMLGGNYTQEQLASRIAGGGGSSMQIGSLTVAPSFGDIGNYSRSELMEIFKEGLLGVLREGLAAKGATG